MAVNQHVVSSNNLLMIMVDWPWRLLEMFSRSPFKYVNNIAESRWHSIKRIFFLYRIYNRVHQVFSSQVYLKVQLYPENWLLCSSWEDDSCFGLPLLLFAHVEMWMMICLLHITSWSSKSSSTTWRGTGHQGGPRTCSTDRDEISLWIP